MPLSAIVDSSVLFTASGIGATISNPWAYRFNGSSYRLEKGRSFQHTYYGRNVDIYGSGGNAQLDIDGGDGWSLSVVKGTMGGNQGLANEAINGFDFGELPPEGQPESDKKVITLTVLGRPTEIDFILYEPSTSRSFAGVTLLLDDQDESVTFSGSWNQSGLAAYANATFGFPTGVAMKWTYSQTREPGAAFKAGFVGSNIQVYGAIQQVEGSVTIDYTIDGSFSETVTLSPTSQGVNRTNWELNRLLFGHSDKSFYADEKAEHSLEVTVKEVTGDQVFTLDYLTFEGTPWTNVVSGKALASPLPDTSGATRTHKVASGLGPALQLVGLLIGFGIF